MGRDKVFSKKFQKIISKLKGKELDNLIKKVIEILNSNKISNYKSLRYDLSNYKRVHLNKSYVILFYERDEVIYFDNYLHHDKAYLK